MTEGIVSGEEMDVPKRTAGFNVLGFAAVMLLAAPALGSGGGGGGGGVDSPSASAPSYDPAVEYQKGIQALGASDFKKALSAFRNVLVIQPNDANTNYLAGLSAIGLANWKKADGYLIKAIKADPNLLSAHRQLGVVKVKLGDVAGATIEREFLHKKLIGCGESCSTSAELKAAIGEIDTAIASGPTAAVSINLPQAFINTGRGDQEYATAVALINEHRYADAIETLQDARKSFGAHPDILTYLGFANRKLGQLGIAEGYYRAALAIYPNHLGALEYYGELKVERGDFAGARANLAKLDRLCTFGCHQAEELRLWVNLGRSPAAS